MSNLPLTLAMHPYDHVADLTTGRVVIEGVDLRYLPLYISDIFFRFANFREFDVSEFSLAKYSALRSQDENWVTAIPVFTSRVFRHSAIYIRRDGPIASPSDLSGRRIGLPEWAQTAQVYIRGMLAHQYGLDLTSVDWVQAGVDEPGRNDYVPLSLPGGYRLTRLSDKTLSDMLVSGEIDALFVAEPPKCFEERHPNIGRLFEDFVDVERRYFAETGIFPIMHTVAIRQEVVDRNPWVVINLLRAFEEAKKRSLRRATWIGLSSYPIPWSYVQAEMTQREWGDDFWPYGIEANRKTINAFLQYAFEQGVCARRLQPEDIFAPQALKSFII